MEKQTGTNQSTELWTMFIQAASPPQVLSAVWLPSVKEHMPNLKKAQNGNKGEKNCG